MTRDTIFALSSGAPPAAIGIIRISGPKAGEALTALSGALPTPRTASLRTLKAADEPTAGDVLDTALVLWFPGPDTATGEDLAELHCHGGRAVVSAIEAELAAMEGLRPAQAGEFTRRAFANGQMDLAQAEALADLLSAETQLQRQAAQAGFGGAISQLAKDWRKAVLLLSAQLEAVLDFSDEEDAADLPASFFVEAKALAEEMAVWLSHPPAERLRDGVRVVLAGPPNAGKSSLFNALLDDAAAITSAEAGTTRDAIERPIALSGVPLVLVDTAGLREDGAGAIEAIGIERAQTQMDRADIVLWLGAEGAGPEGAIAIQTKCDEPDAPIKAQADYRVSAVTREGLAELEAGLVSRAKALLPKPGQGALNARQRAMVTEAQTALFHVEQGQDMLLTAESLRQARVSFDRLLGAASTEDMLDTLFGGFCIGK
jgi:tRNA modification GTPase